MTSPVERAALIAARANIAIKAFSLDFVCGQAAGRDDKITDDEILANLRRLQIEFPTQFADTRDGKPGAPRETAVEMLERANAVSAKREKQNAPPPPKPLTEEEKKYIATLSASQRMDWAERRNADQEAEKNART